MALTIPEPFLPIELSVDVPLFVPDVMKVSASLKASLSFAVTLKSVPALGAAKCNNAVEELVVKSPIARLPGPAPVLVPVKAKL